MMRPDRELNPYTVWSEGSPARTSRRTSHPHVSLRRARRLRRTAASESGQGIVEFALALPLLAMLVFAFIAFGKAIYYYIELTHVANEGARVASVNGAQLGSGQTLTSYLCNQFGTSSELYTGSSTVSPAHVVTDDPDAAPPDPTVGKPIRVTISTTYNWFPFMNLLPITISGSATMRTEQPITSSDVYGTASC